MKAIAYLTGDTIKGTVYFTQNGCGQPVLVDVNITGLTEGEHGFHIHEKGDLSGGCLSLGAHYNPDKVRLHVNSISSQNQSTMLIQNSSIMVLQRTK